MSDYLLRLASQPTLRNVIKSVGLPTPVELKRAGTRYADQPLAGLQVLFGTAKDAAVATAVRGELEGAGATVIAQAAEGAKYAYFLTFHEFQCENVMFVTYIFK